MSILSQADQIEAFARLIGCDVSVSRAATGSRYLTLEHDWTEAPFVVRIADHGECYCREQISVDPTGATVAQAQEAIAEHFGFPAPAKCRAAASKWRAAEAINDCFAVLSGLHPDSDRAAFVADRIAWSRTAADRKAWATVAASL